ncbi:MAG: hypothetical protein AAF846_09610 [Chloroflexota bacterium]
MKRLFALCLLIFPLIIIAQDDVPYDLSVDTEQFPTYALVTETDLPELNRYDIVYRLNGITAGVAIPLSPPTRQIGDQDIFRISRLDGYVDVPMTLRFISEHVYLWLEDTIVADEASLQQFTDRFDRDVYQAVRDLWGEEASPSIDGDVRLHVVITQQMSAGYAGYYSPSNALPRAIAESSNERDMLILDDFVLQSNVSDIGISVAAHEFFHMVHDNIDTGESSWINEGVAVLTEHLLGMNDSQSFIEAFMNSPEISFVHWGTSGNFSAEYGNAMLFMLYLHDRFGLDAVREIVLSTDDGIASVDVVLANYGTTFDETFADWVVANILADSDTIYGYPSLPVLPSVNFTNFIPAQSFIDTRLLQPYGTHYYRFYDVPDSATIQLIAPDTVPLLPISPTSGEMMWYSQRGDLSNPTLTRAFDLREVYEAELTFNIWHDLETDWDYAYVSISTDGGERWQLQSTDLMTNTNPNERAYGAAYTGRDSAWRMDRLNLNAYIGQEILVRFEMVMDDAIAFNGVAIDDIRLDAIGYHHDAETDDGNWIADGWIRTDNRLPQRTWVQVIEQTSGEPIVHRFLSTGNEPAWTIDFSDDTQRVYIAISPFAPMTSQAIQYTLQVDS